MNTNECIASTLTFDTCCWKCTALIISKNSISSKGNFLSGLFLMRMPWFDLGKALARVDSQP